MANASVTAHNREVAHDMITHDILTIPMQRALEDAKGPAELVSPDPGSPAFAEASMRVLKDSEGWEETRKELMSIDKVQASFDFLVERVKAPDTPDDVRLAMMSLVLDFEKTLIKAAALVRAKRAEKPAQSNVQVNLDTGGIDVGGHSRFTRPSVERKASRARSKTKEQGSSTSPPSHPETDATSRPDSSSEQTQPDASM